MRVRLRRSEGRLEDSHSHGSYRKVQLLGVDAVPIMNQKAIVLTVVNGFAKLLQGPSCRGMGSEIQMDESPCSYLHDQKHINDLKANGDGDEEIAGQHSLGMVADEGHPALG